MNHIYRSVWNEISRTYVAAAEIVRGKGKDSKSSRSAEGSEADLEAGSNLAGATGEQGPPARPAGLRFGGFRSMALEQRFMFDGAAVDTAITSLDAIDANSSAEPAAKNLDLVRFSVESVPQAVATAEADVNHLISDFLAQPQARDQLFALFNGGQGESSAQWQVKVDAFLEAINNGEFQVTVELLDGDTLQGAKGAFAASGTDGKPVIYLNRDWLQAGADSGSVTTVLTEELGHAIDHYLNGNVDTAGDEGEAFSALLINGQLRLEAVQLDDAGVIQINGQDVAVEFASYTFVNAYQMVYDLNNNGVIEGNLGETAAEKEQSSHNFDAAGLGQVRINDGTNGQQFSGNDVSATSIVVGGQTYNGWISRPIKSGGIVRGFYFWTDLGGTIGGKSAFTDLATAQADGNQDGDGSATDNKGFLLVVDQAWFTTQISSTATTVATAIDGTSLTTYSKVGSSSDRVDSALNALLPVNVAPVAVADSATANEAGGLSNATTGTDPTGNVLSNDTDSNSGDTKTVTSVGTTSADQSVTVSGTPVTGSYGTLTLKADGSYTYVVANSNAAVQALRTTSNTLSDTFTYTMKDTAGLTSTTTLTVTVQGANDTPTANADYNTAKESLSASLPANGVSYDANDPLGATANGNVLSNETDLDAFQEGKSIVGIEATATTGTVTAGGTSTDLTFTAASTLSPVSKGDYAYINIGGIYKALIDAAGNPITVTGKSLVTGTADSYRIGLSATPAKYFVSGSTYQSITDLSNMDNDVSSPHTADMVGFSAKRVDSGPSGLKSATVSVSTSVDLSSVALSSFSGTVSAGMSVTWNGYTGNPVTVQSVTYDAAGNPTSIGISSTTTINSSNLPAGTTLTLTGSAGTDLIGRYGTLALATGGDYTYTPFVDNTSLNAGQSGLDAFTYTMKDTFGAKATATLSITVYGSSASDPNAKADTNTITEAGGTGNIGGTSAAGNVLTGTITSPNGVTGGAADIAGTGSNQLIGARAAGDATESTIYATASGTITRNSATITSVANTANLAVGMTATGTGIPAGTTITALSGSSVTLSSTVSANNGIYDILFVHPSSYNLTLSGQYGSLAINSNGSYTYTVDNSKPAVEALRTSSDTLNDVFTYRISNGQFSSNALLSDSTTLSITIQGANDAPVASNDTATAIEASGANNAVAGYNPTGNILSNDTDVDDAASELRVTAIRKGATEGSGTAGTVGTALSGSYGSLTLSADGSWSYAVNNTNSAVNALAVGDTLTESFNYTVTDRIGTGLTDIGVLTITIQGANDTISVNSVFVNEASPYAVFSVSGAQGIQVSLALSDTTGLSSSDVKATLGTDTAANSSLQYYNGSSWVSYNAGSPPAIPAGGQLYVRLAITQDNIHEGNESFTLTATAVGNDISASTGITTINDEGEGSVFLATSNTGTANTSTDSGYPTLDDDRPTISVSSPSVTEGGDAIFTVSIDKTATAPISFAPSLRNGSATIGTDTASSGSLQVSTDGGSNWSTVTGPVTIAAGQTSVQLKIATTDDSNIESSETFTLGTGYISGTVKNPSGVIGTATIADNDAANVAPVNTVPGAQSVNEDTALTFSISNSNLISVNDADGNLASTKLSVGHGTLSVALTGTGATISTGVNGSGTLTLNGTQAQINAALATLAYQGNANFNGSDTLTVVSTDSAGTPLSDTSTLTITVTAANDDFSDANETLTVAEDSGATSGNLLTGTSSVDGAVTIKDFSLAGQTGPFTLGTAYTVSGQGSITVNADGSYSFTPAANWNGSFPLVSYTVTDGSGTDDTSTLTITVTAANDDFSDANETLTVAEDSGATSGNLLTGTSSVDGAVTIKDFSLAGQTGPFTLGTAYTVSGQGSITVNADGSYSFTPAANWNGSFPLVSYTVTDGSGTDDTSTLTITVTAANDDFSDANETLTVAEDSGATSGNLLTGTSSVDGAVTIKDFSLAGQTGPFTLGTAYTVSGQGSITVNADGSYSFTPAANWNGSFPLVSYTVTDGSGTDDTSTLTITVTAANDDFSDANETLTVAEDSGATSGNLLTGTSSVDGAVTIKDFSLAGQTGPFTLGTAYTVSGQGSITVNADGSYSFTPAANWNGSFPLVSYTVTDGSGTDDTSTLTITVTAANDDFSDANETLTVAEDSGATSGNLLTGTSSVDGAVTIKDFSLAGQTGPFTLGTAYTVSGQGSITVNADGSYSFTPAANWNGSFPLVSYTVTDGSGTDDTSTLTITVTAANDDFSDANETLTVAEDSGATSGNLLTGTSSVDGAVTIKDFSLAGQTGPFTLGTAYTVSGQGSITVNADGSYSFTPAANWNGSFPLVSYTVTDGSGTDDTSTLTITVTAANDDFSDANETLTVAEDSGATSGNLLTGTSSVDGAVTIKDFSLAGQTGPFTLGTAYTVSGQGSITVNADGSYSFTPAANWNGSFPLVSYTVTDGSGTDDTSTLTITVTAANDDFSDANETLTVAEDSGATSGNLLTGTSSVDGAVTIKDFSLAGQTGPFTLGTAYTVSGQGSITVNADGSYSFTPAANWNGSFPLVSYTVTDGSGTDDTSTLTITVTAANDDFSDANETLTVAEDSGATSGNLLTGTSSVDGAVTIKDFSLAGQTGPFTLGTAYTVSGQGSITVNADGSYSFTPAANWNGSFPLVSYTVTDGSGTDDTSTLTITVTAANDDFSDANETLTVAEDSGATSGNLLTGTSSVDGAVTIKDFSLAGQTGPFTLGTAYTVSGQGSITVNADGSYSFTPAANWNGSFPLVSYTVTDGSGTDDTSTLTITVTAANDDFSDANETLTVAEDSGATSGNLLTGTSSVDGAVTIKDFSLAGQTGPFTLGTAYTVSGQGSITVNADGSYSFTPAANWNGSFPLVSYTVTDGSGTDDTSTLTITVTAVVDPVTVSSPTVNEASPYAVFTVTGGIGESVTLDLSAGSATDDGVDFGATGETLLEISTDGGLNWATYSAAATFPADGKLLARTPIRQDPVYEGSETFTLTATAAGGTGATGTATIRDDGTGAIFKADGSADTTAPRDDDRPISIAPVTVNEATPYAVFRVEASGGQQFALSLRDGPSHSDSLVSTATAGADYRNSLETYDGVKWIPYTPDTLITVPNGGSVLLVRVPIMNDSEYEDAHAFTLIATIPGAVPVTGNGIIGDYGTGAIFNDSGAEDRLAPKDDDRGIRVDSPIVNEGSEFVVFTIKGSPGPIGLRMPVSYETDEPIATGVDKSQANIQFWDGLVWQTYNGSNASIPAGGTLLVRVGIAGEQDNVREGSEHFALVVTRGGVDSVGEASVRDDGTGVIYQFASDAAFSGTTTIGVDDDFDKDGITPTTEEALATLAASQGIGNAKSGDINGDGKQDAEQNALATLAWTVKDYFIQGNEGTLTESKAIISVSVTDGAGSKAVSTTSQLLDIVVATYDEVDQDTEVVVETDGSRTVTLADGSQATTPWDPIRFAVEGMDADNDGLPDLSDIDLARSGTQVRILVDIRASGLTTEDVNGYIKYVSQEAIDSVGTLVDLDGRAITRAGWYDFTQRQEGGDGARFIDETGDGKIDYIELIITDNAFGDNDATLGKIFDPGTPVRVHDPVPAAPAVEVKPAAELPAAGPIQFGAVPRFEYSPFDSTLYALTASANPMTLGLIERTSWSWADQDRDWAQDPQSETTAADLRWTTLVVPNEVASLQVFRGMGDQFAEGGAQGSFTVPADAFVHTQSGVEVVLTAKLADGSALPRWIRFDARSGKFSFEPSENFNGELRIKLTARDSQGREAVTLFRFHVGDKQVTAAGRAGLSQQLREAAQHKLGKRAAPAH